MLTVDYDKLGLRPDEVVLDLGAADGSQVGRLAKIVQTIPRIGHFVTLYRWHRRAHVAHVDDERVAAVGQELHGRTRCGVDARARVRASRLGP